MLGAMWVPRKLDIENHALAALVPRLSRKNRVMGPKISGTLLKLSGSFATKVWAHSGKN